MCFFFFLMGKDRKKLTVIILQLCLWICFAADASRLSGMMKVQMLHLGMSAVICNARLLSSMSWRYMMQKLIFN